jgi:phosphate transport system protein
MLDGGHSTKEPVMTDTMRYDDLVAELGAFEHALVELGRRARDLLGDAIGTLDGEQEACDAVIAGAADLAAAAVQLEQDAFELVAAESPVGGDLRSMIAMLRACRHIDRIGDAAASIARLHGMTIGLPRSERIRDLLAKMGSKVLGMIDSALRAFESRQLTAIAPMAYTDDLVSELYDEVFWETIADSDDARRLEWALRMYQVSRHLKRAADDALDITEQITFLVAGELDVA